MDYLAAEKELLLALIEIVKTGGMYGIIGLGMWFLFQLLQIAFVGGIIWGCMNLVTRSVRSCLTIKWLKRKEHITLLGSKVSKHVTEALKDFEVNVCNSVTELQKAVKDLEKNSPEEKAKKPASTKK